MNENTSAARPLRHLFGAACVLSLAGCSTLSDWGGRTVSAVGGAVSGAGAAVRDSVAGAPPAVSAPAGRRANDTAPPRQSAPIAPASAVGLGSPTPAPEIAPRAPAPMAAPAPMPVASAPAPVTLPPPVTAPAAAPMRAPAPVAAAPAPVPAPAVPPARAPAPAVAPAPAAPAPRVAAVPPPAAKPAPAVTMAAIAPKAEPRAIAPGRFTVQIAAFAVEANAQTTRDRVNNRLAAAGDALAPGERVAQVGRIGERSVVMVGEYADRAGAEDLAARLRKVLNQDVAVIRR